MQMWRGFVHVEYCNENIKDVYHELFDEALARYNEKQTRNDRKIDDYASSRIGYEIYMQMWRGFVHVEMCRKYP